MRGKTQIESGGFRHDERVSTRFPLSMPVVFPFTTHSPAAKTIVFAVKTILFTAQTIVFTAKTIVFAAQTIVFAARTIVVVVETIVFAVETVVFAAENLPLTPNSKETLCLQNAYAF
jgi:hypothetical protein